MRIEIQSPGGLALVARGFALRTTEGESDSRREIESRDFLPGGQAYEFVAAVNGIFLRAQRRELKVQIPVTRALPAYLPNAGPLVALDEKGESVATEDSTPSHPAIEAILGTRFVAGKDMPFFRLHAGLEPRVILRTEPVPRLFLSEMIRQARAVCEEGSSELLFHLFHGEETGWELVTPEQEWSATACRPTDDGPGSSHARACIEVHSHHSMPASFSDKDDSDERTGFRLYGVIGNIWGEAVDLRMRVGCHGHFFEFDPTSLFE